MPPTGLPPVDPIVEISISSQGISQGVLQTEGPQVIPRLTLRIASVRVGAQWRNLESPIASGVAALFIKSGRRIGKIELEAGAAYRIRTSVRHGAATAAWEFSASARRGFGPVAMRATANYSHDDFGDGESLYVEAGPAVDLSQRTNASWSLGRRERATGPDYTTVSVGLGHRVSSRLTIDARFYATARPQLGAQYRPRLVVAGRVTL